MNGQLLNDTARARPVALDINVSVACVIQHPALKIWKGDDANVVAAHRALAHRVLCGGAALRGAYNDSMEAP